MRVMCVQDVGVDFVQNRNVCDSCGKEFKPRHILKIEPWMLKDSETLIKTYYKSEPIVAAAVFVCRLCFASDVTYEEVAGE